MNAKTICTAALLTLCATPTTAQIIGLELADTKLAKRFKSWMIEKNGRRMLCGEALWGIEVDLNSNPVYISIPQNADSIGFLVPDPAHPEQELVRFEKGEKKVVGKRRTAVIPIGSLGKDGMHLLHDYETCFGLRVEYLRRLEKVAELERTLRKQKSGTPEWFEQQRRLLAALDGLTGWLRSTLFPAAADKTEKKYRSWLRKAGREASETRLETAKATLAEYAPPAATAEAAARFGRPGLAFHGAQTRHLRVVAHAGVPRAVLDNGLLLGERIIEAFRSELVDPYLGPDDRDPIPEELFQGFFLCPDDKQLAVNMLEKHLGVDLGGPHRERRIEMLGHSRYDVAGLPFLDFWRYGKMTDFDGIVAHRLGHTLAELTFNPQGRGYTPAWIGEGFAYWSSYEFIQRNTVTCVAFALPRYDRKADEEGVKPIERGMRAAFNALAIDKGPPLDHLVRKKLVELDAGDLAKSWSVIDWLIAEHPEKLGRILRTACTNMSAERTDIQRLRPALNELFEVPLSKDIYRVLDERWTEYAASGQMETGRKRR